MSRARLATKIRNGDDKQPGDIRRRSSNCFGGFVRLIIKMVAPRLVTQMMTKMECFEMEDSSRNRLV